MAKKRRRDSWNPGHDRRFKALIRDKRVLSKIIGIFVPELEGLSEDELVEMMEDGRISPTSSEILSGKGAMLPDLVFKIQLPDGRSALLDVEGQLYSNPKGEDEARAMLYSAGMLLDQTELPEWEGYRSLIKVYSAWVLMDLRAGESSLVLRSRFRTVSEGLDPAALGEDMDYLEVVRIRVGDPFKASSKSLAALDALFYQGDWTPEREQLVMRIFKLESGDDIILVQSREMNMDLDKEFRDHWTQVGFDQGKAEGKSEGMAEGEAIGIKKERQAQRARMVESYAESVSKAMSSLGATLESALSIVPADIAEDVRKRLEDMRGR
ncbi:MAG: hypothetical protein IKQ60_04655 [Candidatus Methanomethylophilaceae archaeon]|nr:hypothetical protein [Candidatus Methanomethylophilaceae archaeon]